LLLVFFAPNIKHWKKRFEQPLTPAIRTFPAFPGLTATPTRPTPTINPGQRYIWHLVHLVHLAHLGPARPGTFHLSAAGLLEPARPGTIQVFAARLLEPARPGTS
jgi:hypothetical protein